MSIRVRCPRCWETAEVPDEALGKQGVCNSCGALVSIPARMTKVCFICGADVTSSKHAKDRHGNYVCRKCLEGNAAHAKEKSEFEELESSVPSPLPIPESVPIAPSVPPPQPRKAEPAAEPHFELGALEQPHHEEHEHAASPDLAAAVAQSNGSHTVEVRRRGSPMAALLAVVAIGACAVLAFWHMENRSILRTLTGQLAENEKIIRELQERLSAAESTARKVSPDWEDEHRLQILLAKSQAELLVSMGQVRAGIEKYEQLMKLVRDQRVSPTMMLEIRDAQDQLAEARLLDRRAAMAAKTGTVPDIQTPVAQAPAQTQPAIAKANTTPGPTTRPADPPVQAIIPAPLPQARTPETTAPVAPPIKSIFDD